MLEILLILGAIVLAFAMFREFGHSLDPARSRCPGCGTDSLERVEPGRLPGRLEVYRCMHCGRGYRDQLDGSLAEMPAGESR